MAERIYGLTGPSIVKVRRAINRLAQQPGNLRPQFEGDRFREGRPDNRIHVKNESGEIIPAFGVMAETGLEQYQDRWIHVVDKPDTTLRRKNWVNGPIDIPIGAFGIAQNGPQVRVLHDTGTTPVQGNGYGPVPSQWYVGQHYPETLLVAGEHDDAETLLGEWHDINRVIANADANIATGASGTGSILKGVAGSETDTTVNLTGWNAFTAITSGDRMLGLNIDGQWYWVKPGEGTGDFCHINGNAVADIPALSAIAALDFIVGVENGCFVLVPTSTCP